VIKRKAFRKLGASKIGANLVTIPDVITDSYLKINADNTIAAQSSTEFAADFMGDLMTDVKPAIGGVYDIGASGYEWYDGYFYNSVKISDTAITGDAGDLFVTSDSFTVGDISIVDNVLTPLTTPLYGNREVIVDGGLTVASTDPAYLRLTQLLNTILKRIVFPSGMFARPNVVETTR